MSAQAAESTPRPARARGPFTTDVVRLGVYLVRHRPALFLGQLALWVTWWVAPVATGLVLQAVFDAISGQAPARLGFGPLVTVFLAVEAARIAVFYASVVLWARWWVVVTALMRVNLLDAQLASGGPGAARLTDDPGGMVTVFRDDVDDFAMWLDTWLDFSGTLLFAVVAVAVMLRVDVVVTLVVVVPLALAFLINRVLTPRIRGYRHADREATQRVTGFLGELFAAVLAVKVAGAEGSAVARLRELNRERRRTALRDRLLTDGLQGANSSTVDVTIGLVLLLVVGSMRDGTFTVGDLALFTSYIAWLAAFPRWIGRLLARHRHAQVAGARMARLLPSSRPGAFASNRRLPLEDHRSAPPESRAAGARPASVSVRGLRYRYPDGTVGVDGIDLDLDPGSLTVVTGPVGSGKTTLLRALIGLARPDGGELRWNGRPVHDPAAHFVPPRCAYVAQVPRLFSETLQDNLSLGATVSPERLRAALRSAVFHEDVAAMPEGLDTVIGSRGVRLSGGQVQRAATARALLAGPGLLVVDDLSSALDVETERRLWDGLLSERRATVLAVSHRPATLAAADRVVVLEHGRVAAAGSPARLLRSDGDARPGRPRRAR